MSRLSEKRIGFCGEIKQVGGQGLIQQRLYELGFVSGETIEVQRILPFSGPFIVKVRGATLALRREEAGCLHV